MASYNRVCILGNLGRDPEIRYLPTGTAIANFSVATSEKWTDKEGNKQERTEWHRIVAWAKLGEICSEYLQKGSPVFIEGRIRTRDWETQDGERRQTTEIHAITVQFLGRREDREVPSVPRTGVPEEAPETSGTPAVNDDIPF
jgi:single-strand DNA-binding protein